MEGRAGHETVEGDGDDTGAERDGGDGAPPARSGRSYLDLDAAGLSEVAICSTLPPVSSQTENLTCILRTSGRAYQIEDDEWCEQTDISEFLWATNHRVRFEDGTESERARPDGGDGDDANADEAPEEGDRSGEGDEDESEGQDPVSKAFAAKHGFMCRYCDYAIRKQDNATKHRGGLAHKRCGNRVDRHAAKRREGDT